MRTFTLSDFLDTLFYTVAAWFFALGILRYFRVGTGVAIAFCSLVAAAVGIVSALLLLGARNKKRTGKREKEEREKLLLHLALEKEERVRALLSEAFLAEKKNAVCEKDTLRVDGTLVVPLFTMQPLSADRIAELLKRVGEEDFLIACNALSPEAEKLLLGFGKKAMRGEEVYALLSKTGCIPEKLICGELPRKTPKQKLQRSFSKKNARPFFVSGLLLLFMSLFTVFPLYYLIAGSVLLFTSVFVRAFGYAG